MWVTGGQLVGTNGNSTIVGDNGAGQMTVSNGTVLLHLVETGSSGTITIAGGTNQFFDLSISEFSSSTGAVWVTGGLLSASSGLNVGAMGAGEMTVSNGTVVLGSLFVGANAGSSGALTVDGGSLTVTNPLTTALLVVGFFGQGALTLNGGTVTTEALIITNGANSVFNYNGGALNTVDTTVANGSTFAVGDGTHAATFHLLGGVHSFANGLLISTNASLTGCGTIIGAVVNQGTITNNCTTLNFNNVITNNGTIVVGAGATAVFDGTVVNNGLIDATAGTVVFLSNVVNSGTVDTNHVPVASFNGSPTNGASPLTVTFSDTSTGTITNRSWIFGDGGTTNTLNTTVLYTYNFPGTDTVTLIVTGPLGASTNTVVNLIVVTNGPPHLVVTPGSANFGLQAVGQTATQTFSVGNTGFQTLTGTATVSGASFAIVSGSPFSVNGGQTGLVNVTFSPGAVGAFTGSVLFASNGGASSNAITGSAAIAPAAGFTAAPTNGTAPLLVNFTDASSGTVTSSVWAFGDGGTSTLTSPSHSYTTAGTFSVSLTVSGPLGSNTLMLANLITVTNVFVPPPVAAFTATPTNGGIPLLVNFTDASTGAITNHSWTFGDGGASAAASPSHTYSIAGIYSVGLTVSGPGGSSATNLANLITVTNVVGVPPTVNILRPANGMLYPPATNLTITIVANATANDGTAITKIEFFADGNKFAETTSNPGTNFLLNPTLGTHVLMARATDAVGATNTATATITVGAKNSPVGDWEVTISSADKGAQFLTFEDDFTASGYAIRFKTFGLDQVSGQWGFDAKGQVTGPFVEQTDGVTNWTGTLSSKVKSFKSVIGTVPTSVGTFHWKGIPATTFRDLSGTWTGLVTVAKVSTAVSYAITNNASNSAVFDIAATNAPATVVGQLLVTSRNQIYGYITFASKPINFSGSFNVPRGALLLKGTDATAEKVTINLFQQ